MPPITVVRPKRQVIVKITTVGGHGRALLIKVAGEVADSPMPTPSTRRSAPRSVRAHPPSRWICPTSRSSRGRHRRPAQGKAEAAKLDCPLNVVAASPIVRRVLEVRSSSGTSGLTTDSSNQTLLPSPGFAAPAVGEFADQPHASSWRLPVRGAGQRRAGGAVSHLDPDVRRGDVDTERKAYGRGGPHWLSVRSAAAQPGFGSHRERRRGNRQEGGGPR